MRGTLTIEAASLHDFIDLVTFFKQAYETLDEEGTALVHTIGRADGPGITDAWTAKYFFPNSYAPALSEIVRAVQQTGFCITDIAVLRTHYAETIAEWCRRFESVRDRIVSEYDELFFRMFGYYLKTSEFAFRSASWSFRRINPL